MEYLDFGGLLRKPVGWADERTYVELNTEFYEMKVKVLGGTVYRPPQQIAGADQKISMALILAGPTTGTSWIVIWPLLTTTGIDTSSAVFGATAERIS